MKAVGIAVAAAAVLGTTALPAWSGGTGAVQATVRMAAPCLTVSYAAGGSIDFGRMTFGTAPKMAAGAASLTNCAGPGLAETVSFHGTSALSRTNTASWQLALSCGTNRYRVMTGFGGVHRAAAYNDIVFPQQLAVGTTPVDVAMQPPCGPGSSGAGETFDFSVVYTASL